MVVVARRRDSLVPPPPDGRPFTPAELARIRDLTATPLDSATDGHPNRRSAELDRLHERAGRRRTFKEWELIYDAQCHDADAAFLEEVSGELPPKGST